MSLPPGQNTIAANLSGNKYLLLFFFQLQCRHRRDAIQFIELMEKCSKHDAIVKAVSLINGVAVPPVQQTIPTAKPALSADRLFIEADVMAKEAVLTKLFKYFAKALPLTKKAVDYLEGRSINYKLLEVGYNSGDWHHKLNEKHFVQSSESYGLLKAKPAGGFTTWGKRLCDLPAQEKRKQNHLFVWKKHYKR